MPIFRKRGKWFIDYYFEGRRIRECVGASRREAEHALSVRKSEILQGKYNFKKQKTSPQFSEFAKDYLEYSKANKRSWIRDVSILKSLTPFFKMLRLNGITCKHVENYKVKRQEKLSPGGINRELACLKHMFTMAIKWGYTEKNPVKEVKMLKEKEKIIRVLSYENEKKLIENAGAHIKPILILALNTGMRIGEILNLTWDRMDMAYGIITVDDTKGGEVRSIPINSSLIEVLRTLEKHGKYVFSKENGDRYGSIKTAFNAAKRRAGITNLRIHDLRHTFASRLVLNGVDLVTVKELLGHKDISTTMRYSHTNPGHKKIAVEMLVLPEYGHQMDTKGFKKSVIKERIEVMQVDLPG